MGSRALDMAGPSWASAVPDNVPRLDAKNLCFLIGEKKNPIKIFQGIYMKGLRATEP